MMPELIHMMHNRTHHRRRVFPLGTALQLLDWPVAEQEELVRSMDGS